MDAQRQAPLSPYPALDALKLAVKAAGGPSKVARAAGVNRTHLANILGGVPMGRETATRLRPHVKMAPEAWVELLMPLDDAEPTTPDATP
jgi:plasmid maintenance system antidote protein VapI